MIKSSLICAAFALALTLTAADDHSKMKGGEHMMSMNKTATPSEGSAMKSGNSMPMDCGMGMSGQSQNGTTEKGHMKMMMAGEKHASMGCSSVTSVVGVGKAAKDEVKHVCGTGCNTSDSGCAMKAEKK